MLDLHLRASRAGAGAAAAAAAAAGRAAAVAPAKRAPRLRMRAVGAYILAVECVFLGTVNRVSKRTGLVGTEGGEELTVMG